MTPLVLVVSIDGLGAGWLGPYGHTLIDTPTLNQFAAESLLCEFVLSDACELDSVLHSHWRGRPAWSKGSSGESTSLAEIASSAGYRTRLVTDVASLVSSPLAHGFQETVLCEHEEVRRLASDVEEMQFTRLLLTAAEAVEESDAPLFIWVQAQGMYGPWDAPFSWRSRLVGEDDPTPGRFFEPPSLRLAEGFDPDELLGYVQAYAGQVAACDEAMSLLLDAVERRHPTRDVVIALTSPRGFALGEHQAVGSNGNSLRGEVLQTPLVIRLPGRQHRLRRLGDIFQPADLHATLAKVLAPTKSVDSWGRDFLDVAEGKTPDRGIAIAVGQGERAARTEAWFLHEIETDDGTVRELYVKPDDRWEANDVASLCPAIVEELSELLASVIEENHPPLLPASCSESLLHGLE